jgi:chorismate mutase
MACNDHRLLSEHSMAILTKVEMLVEELLENKSVLPQELITKLGTYHADLTAAIEGKQTGT